jgi:hypothetical protein
MLGFMYAHIIHSNYLMSKNTHSLTLPSYEATQTTPSTPGSEDRDNFNVAALAVSVPVAFVTLVVGAWQTIRWYREGRPRGECLGSFTRSVIADYVRRRRLGEMRHDSEVDLR